ncbi:MAG TPA: transglycosylase SLT domain-containing protein [Marmoricola sp.]
MVSLPRRLTAAAPFLAVVLLASVLAAPADARGEPWPGHPDRRLVSHVVAPGDTATGLAVRYHAWTRELVALNDLGPDAALRVGDRIRIPVVVSAAKRDRRRSDESRRPQVATKSPPPAAGAARSVRLRAAGWEHWRMSRAEVRSAIARTARRHGVPVRLAQAVAWQESGWHQPLTSSAGALGVMQVLPSTGLWMSLYAGRPLQLRDTHDNILAGVTLLRVLLDETRTTRRAVAAYYQGLAGVREHGMYAETRAYVADVMALRRRL